MKSKYRYEIIVYWSDEDQAFTAEVPELPGCAADGQSYQEAIAQAETVIDEWIETARASVELFPNLAVDSPSRRA